MIGPEKIFISIGTTATFSFTAAQSRRPIFESKKKPTVLQLDFLIQRDMRVSHSPYINLIARRKKVALKTQKVSRVANFEFIKRTTKQRIIFMLRHLHLRNANAFNAIQVACECTCIEPFSIGQANFSAEKFNAIQGNTRNVKRTFTPVLDDLHDERFHFDCQCQCSSCYSRTLDCKSASTWVPSHRSHRIYATLIQSRAKSLALWKVFFINAFSFLLTRKSDKKIFLVSLSILKMIRPCSRLICLRFVYIL